MNNIRLIASVSKHRSLVCFFIIISLLYLSCSEKKISIEMDYQNSYQTVLFNNYSCIRKNMTGEMVRYEVAFYPKDNDKCVQEFEMTSGLLTISPIIRVHGECWENTNDAIQQISYPVCNKLPSFEIIDDLNQPDSLEGFRLDFYDYAHNLLRTESLSVEEWLFLIGEINQLYGGYLQIDVSGNTHDLLTPE